MPPPGEDSGHGEEARVKASWLCEARGREARLGEDSWQVSARLLEAQVLNLLLEARAHVTLMRF